MQVLPLAYIYAVFLMIHMSSYKLEYFFQNDTVVTFTNLWFCIVSTLILLLECLPYCPVKTESKLTEYKSNVESQKYICVCLHFLLIEIMVSGMLEECRQRPNNVIFMRVISDQ